MNRRRFLRDGALASATLLGGSTLGLLPGCTAPVVRTPAPTRRDFLAPETSYIETACNLPPVRVSADREIRTVVGLRPFRRPGFRVEAESLGDTLIVHNYGHGGGGITLSWGTSKLAVDLGAQGRSGTAAVIGCGAVGLATARLLQEAGFAVTIYAEALPPDTTSNIAGGQWLPYLVAEPERRTAAFDRQFDAAARYAHRRYQLMVGPRYGVRWLRNYFLSHRAWREDSMLGARSALGELLPERRALGPGEHPFTGFEHVRQIDTMFVEPSIYLPAMMEAFQIAGGRIVVRAFRERQQLQELPEKLVFNCTGLGARALFGDEELVAVKGQLTILLPQPEVQYAACPGDFYMFPRSDGIVLGGTHEEDVWSLEPDPDAKARILAGHKAFFDGFRGCA